MVLSSSNSVQNSNSWTAFVSIGELSEEDVTHIDKYRFNEHTSVEIRPFYNWSTKSFKERHIANFNVYKGFIRRYV